MLSALLGPELELNERDRNYFDSNDVVVYIYLDPTQNPQREGVKQERNCGMCCLCMTHAQQCAQTTTRKDLYNYYMQGMYMNYKDHLELLVMEYNQRRVDLSCLLLKDAADNSTYHWMF